MLQQCAEPLTARNAVIQAAEDSMNALPAVLRDTVNQNAKSNRTQQQEAQL